MTSKELIKSLFRSIGYDLSRLSTLQRARNQPADDPFLHQKRLLLNQKVKIVFDIGANIGRTIARYRQLFPEAVIYGFEPFEKSYSVIFQTYKNCKLIKPFKLAVANSVGRKRFFCSNESVMNSLLPLSSRSSMLSNATNSAVVEVETTTLDVFCEENGIKQVQILKMDIQGGELLALEGSVNLLGKGAIEIIYVEVNFNEIYDHQAYFHDISRFLMDHQYYLYGLYNVAYSPAGPIGWADAIFISPQILKTLTHSFPLVQ